MISEGTVIRMFGNSHQLYYIIPGIFNIWDKVISKLTETAYAFTFLGHTRMTFVNEQVVEAADIEIIVFPIEGFGRIPDLTGKILCQRVLDHPCNISGKAFIPALFGMYHDFDFPLVNEPLTIFLIRKENLPIAVFIRIQSVGISLPVIEIAKKVKILCVWSPFPVYPAFLFTVMMKPEP